MVADRLFDLDLDLLSRPPSWVSITAPPLLGFSSLVATILFAWSIVAYRRR
jgi:hypothetical protein